MLIKELHVQFVQIVKKSERITTVGIKVLIMAEQQKYDLMLFEMVFKLRKYLWLYLCTLWPSHHIFSSGFSFFPSLWVSSQQNGAEQGVF